MKYLLAIATFAASSLSCTAAQRAATEKSLAQALTDEQLACMMAEHAPGVSPDEHAAIVAGCNITGAAIQAALQLLEVADRVAIAHAKKG